MYNYVEIALTERFTDICTCIYPVIVYNICIVSTREHFR